MYGLPTADHTSLRQRPGFVPAFVIAPSTFSSNRSRTPTLSLHAKPLHCPFSSPFRLPLTKLTRTAAVPRAALANPSQIPPPPQYAQPAVLPDRTHSTHLPLHVLGHRLLIPGRLVLMTVPFLWACYNVSTKAMYVLPWSLSPLVFNALRLLVASLFMLPQLVRSSPRPDRHPEVSPVPQQRGRVVAAGVEQGLLNIFGNIVQIIALRSTGASRACFLSQLCTIIVPIMAFVTGMETKLSLHVGIAAVTSVFGVALLTMDGGTAGSSPFSDMLLLVGAVVAALNVTRGKRFAELEQPGLIAALKVMTQGLFAFAFIVACNARRIFCTPLRTQIAAALAGATPLMLALNVALVLFNGIIVSAYGAMIQFRAQQMVSASEAVIIFTSMPLWASVLAIPLGERFGLRGIVGALVILVSAVIASGEVRWGRILRWGRSLFHGGRGATCSNRAKLVPE